MDRSRLQLESPSSVMKLEIGCLFVLVLCERLYRLSILKPPGSVQFFVALQSLVVCMNVHSVCVSSGSALTEKPSMDWTCNSVYKDVSICIGHVQIFPSCHPWVVTWQLVLTQHMEYWQHCINYSVPQVNVEWLCRVCAGHIELLEIWAAEDFSVAMRFWNPRMLLLSCKIIQWERTCPNY